MIGYMTDDCDLNRNTISGCWGGNGDMYITVNVEVPKRLNSEQKEALNKFAEVCGEEPYETRKSFFDTMKEIFKQQKVTKKEDKL